MLLEIGADPRLSHDTLISVVAEGTAEGLSLLLTDARVTIEEDDGHLLTAVESDNIETLRVLLQDGREDPSYDESVALKTAVDLGQTEMVKLLLADGRSDPSESHNEAIHDAVKYSFNDIFDLLVEDERVQICARRVSDGYGLEDAILRGNAYVVSRILDVDLEERGVDVGLRWAINLAAKIGQTKIMALLLDSGTQNEYGLRDALKIAKRRRHLDIVKLLEQSLNKEAN